MRRRVHPGIWKLSISQCGGQHDWGKPLMLDYSILILFIYILKILLHLTFFEGFKQVFPTDDFIYEVGKCPKHSGNE